MKEVLVIDDDDDIRGFIEILLERKGYKCMSYRDFDASEIDFVPDVIMLDYLLSGKNGVDVCLAIRRKKELKTVPIIMISALSDVKAKCLAAGADIFISKPFHVTELLESLQKILTPPDKP